DQNERDDPRSRARASRARARTLRRYVTTLKSGSGRARGGIGHRLAPSESPVLTEPDPGKEAPNQHPGEQQPRTEASVSRAARGAEKIQPARRQREAVPGQGGCESGIDRLQDSELVPASRLAARGSVVRSDEAPAREAAAEEVGVRTDLLPAVALDD